MLLCLSISIKIITTLTIFNAKIATIYLLHNKDGSTVADYGMVSLSGKC